MESTTNNQSRYLTVVLLVIAFFLFLPAIRFCTGQIYYQRAQIRIQQQAYNSAIKLLQEAASWLPWDSSIHYSLGMAYLTLAWQTNDLIQKAYYSIAVEQLRKAEQLNMLEPEIAVSLAYALEAQNESNPEKILAAYRLAANLAPNSVQYVELLADKLWQFGHQKEMLAAVETLGRIYPSSYYRIYRKTWWTEAAEEHFKRGLRQGLAQSNTWTGLADNDVRRARIILANMLAKENNWGAAAEQQRLALTLEQRDNSYREYFQLADYYLHSKNLAAAYKALLTGSTLVEPTKNYLQELLSLFQQSGNQAAFPDFYRLLRSELSFSYVEDLQLAEFLIKEQQDIFAVEILHNLTKEQDYLEKPWQLLAEIYRRQGKTTAMKAALAKANQLKPTPTSPAQSLLP